MRPTRPTSTFLFFGLVAALGAPSSRASDPPSVPVKLAGTWKLNKELSDDPGRKMMEAMRNANGASGHGGPGGGGMGGPGGGGMGAPGRSGGRAGGAGWEDPRAVEAWAVLGAAEDRAVVADRAGLDLAESLRSMGRWKTDAPAKKARLRRVVTPARAALPDKEDEDRAGRWASPRLLSL